ncbi:hypothetical protein OPV22_012981 [Ensete ventricosum]|uniref:Uncharacterized protein n=1 Tax=Ensete ventricosum TaxID=4639 RepID=A0AAV8R794_ENSVE|nr:hypothetical protein OPV22_012981 [Ensete ventricosum]
MLRIGLGDNCFLARIQAASLVNLRSQILKWLSQSPWEMESYIRPGCVVLSIYLRMQSIAREELENDLLQHVTSLVQSSEAEFWQNGRFLVRTNRQLGSHKNGKICLSKTWRAWSSPELTSGSPIAVVGWQKSSLVLEGRNLIVPGTKIRCTYMGKYMLKFFAQHIQAPYMMIPVWRGLTFQEDLRRPLVAVSLRWKMVSKGTVLQLLFRILSSVRN